ncbi:MAG: fumarate hydratase [Niameybacter sp.]|uniref:fumarate hydratase n=1 Tax=Niameybacter sp. TaxID=2033640 RepID=UPI002FE6DDF4
MKKIHVNEVIEKIRMACIEANYKLPNDMLKVLEDKVQQESNELGKEILKDICKNAYLAEKESIPICQDTGTAVVFVKLGQAVSIEGGLLSEAINEGVRRGYEEGYLRKSIVENPIYRKNTGDNTPAIIHYDLVSGDEIEMIVAPKGGGSENMSKVYMLTPSQGIEGVEQAVLETVRLAGSNACLPMVVGIGIGGNFEQSTLLAKKALMRSVGEGNKDKRMQAIEVTLLKKINALGIGPQGLGGETSALAVHIEDYPCHIASMPLAVNIGCHVNRHVTIRF